MADVLETVEKPVIASQLLSWRGNPFLKYSDLIPVFRKTATIKSTDSHGRFATSE